MNNLNWQNFNNRIRQEIDFLLRNNNSHKEQGVVMLDIRVIANNCEPLAWTIEGKRFEPSSKAKTIFDSILLLIDNGR